MSESVETPSARQRRSWFSWIWLVPLIAVGIVVWLAIRALVDRGPLITISFSDAEGLQAGDTKVRHKDVDLGTVESIYLDRDLSRVMVSARMRRSVERYLNADTRFWIVRPRVGAGGISGLSTLVSGSYIEMYPGARAADVDSQRSFVGLDDPPVMRPDTPGRSFTLQTDDLGSLIGGSPVSYRGVPVGEIEGYQLDSDGKQINIFAFVRSPYDKFVTAATRFWNSGGIDLAVGVQGLRFRASSWQQLISGGVSFDTPDAGPGSGESAGGTVFRLYGNQYDAQRDPRGKTLAYRATFHGGAGDIGPGTDVQLEGAGVGQVTESRLQFDDASQSLMTRVKLEIDPSRIEIVPRIPKDAAQAATTGAPTEDPTAALGARIEQLVARGMRAHLVTANFLTGSKVVSLDMVPEAPPARIVQRQGMAEIPTTDTTDVTALLANLQHVLKHIDTVAGSPELGHAIKELDATLTHLDQVSAEIKPQIEPLMASLRGAAEAAQRAMQSASGVLGTSAASGSDLPHLVRELTDAARSLRDLADYLERHPESLLRGRKVDQKVDKP